MKMFRFHKNYFLITLLLFVIELLIALFVHDNFIRPYFGDFLVVILIYCFLKSFLNLSVATTAIIVLLFAFLVESSQYLNLIALLGMQNSTIAKAILGNSFSWLDIACYTTGILFLIYIEKKALQF